MAKTKTPFFSMGAHGSLGKTLTAQKRGSQTMVRRRPLPTGPVTLPQTYHRWLYQNYVAWWKTLTTAQKQVWNSQANRANMTGMSLFLQSRLSLLPDLAAGYHLDRISGSLAIDFSKNLNHGTIYGATPITGIIDHALSFDGVDDRITIPHHASISLASDYSICFFIKTSDLSSTDILGKIGGNQYNYHFFGSAGVNKIRFQTYDGVNNPAISSTTPIRDGTWHHIAVIRDAGTDYRLYVDGLADAIPVADTITLPIINTASLVLMGFLERGFTEGIMDEVLLFNRTLTPAEVLLHSLRRYPA